MRAKIAGCLVSLGVVFLMGSGAAFAAPDPEPFIVGKVRVTALQDLPGEMPVAIFRGADMETMRKLVPAKTAPAGIVVFLVQMDGRNILIDTGSGLDTAERKDLPEELRKKSALPELLRRVGVKAGDIDTVLLTHMHGDHIGGLAADGKASFPKATIMAGEKELGFWTDPQTLREKPGLEANARQVKEMLEAYGDRVKTFAPGDTGIHGITALDAPGHTPGHTMFLLVSENSRLLFWGDIVHAAALQFVNPDICAMYDMAMPEAVSSRRDAFAKAANENIPVAGAHLPYPAVGRVKKSAGGEYAFTPGL